LNLVDGGVRRHLSLWLATIILRKILIPRCEVMGVAGDSMLLLEVGFFGGAFGKLGLIEVIRSMSTAEDGRVMLKRLDDGST
jgi:hypothetical protein